MDTLQEYRDAVIAAVKCSYCGAGPTFRCSGHDPQREPEYEPVAYVHDDRSFAYQEHLLAPAPGTKTMPVREFWELGFIQEINRLVLHPCGLALSVNVDTEPGGTRGAFGEIWDYREDPEGIVFTEDTIDPVKAAQVKRLHKDHEPYRVEEFGWPRGVQPIVPLEKGAEHDKDEPVNIGGADLQVVDLAGETKAPWTREQVDNLNHSQQHGKIHPYTCPNRGDGLHQEDESGADAEGKLVATTAGWVCMDCDYTQNWAHTFSTIAWPAMDQGEDD